MKGCAAAAVALMLCTAVPDAAQPRRARARPAPPLPAQVPSPVSIGRLRLQVRSERLLVTTDVTLPRAQAEATALDIHVGYGAPGVPQAFDAQVIATPVGYLVAPVDATGARLAHEASVRAPTHAAFHLGRAELGGQLVHLPAHLLREAQLTSGRATLRIREVLAMPPTLADASHEVVVRLGAIGGTPMTLGLIEFASDRPMGRIDARYCTVNGEHASLCVSTGSGRTAGTAPPLAARDASDDVCIRFAEAATGQEATRTR